MLDQSPNPTPTLSFPVLLLTFFDEGWVGEKVDWGLVSNSLSQVLERGGEVDIANVCD